ncbi:titin homolog isoform X2 [Benincasa hispida]|uniref:titin homolog isoform X2 n=1 Tax=Benincasa hispida TaxID=102211 RepID=UPI001902769B|nr:titin homolog isoform X2 [Benincasa hispida]
MATQTVDSHQTYTSDEQKEKLSSEPVKVAEQINLSSPQKTIEDDREKGRADNLRIPDSTLSTSKEMAVDIQLEKEATSISEEATAAAANETLHEERRSAEPVEGEATELPVIAYLEKSIKEFDATDNGKSPPEEQPTVEVIERETLEVPAEAAAQKVEEQPSEVVDLPKLQNESSRDIVYSEEKEEPGAHVHFVTEVADKVEMVSEKVEEKNPTIIDNTILSVEAHSSKGPTDAEEEPVTECVSVEKGSDKEPETDVPKEPVEPPKKEAQAIEAVPLEELIEGVAKENFGRVEPPTEKEQPVELHPFKGLEEAIAKEISIPTKVPKEKQQGSEIEAGQESSEVIETKISESIEVSHECEIPVEVHLAKEQVVIEKETNESFKPPKNKEQSDEATAQKESVEVTTKEVSASFEPPKNDEQADGSLSATKSGEVKENETNDSTLGFEVERQEKVVIEVKDGIRELPEITKHVQDTYVEAETVTDEKPLAPRDDTGLPIKEKIQKEEGSDKESSECQMAESGPTKDSVNGSEKEHPTTEFASIKKETRLTPETTCVLEEFVGPPKKEQPIEVVPVKEPVQVFAKEDIEKVEPPIEKKQPVVVAKEISEDIKTGEPPIEKMQPVVVANEISEVVTKEVTKKVETSTEKQQSEGEVTAKETSEVVAKEVMEMSEPPTEKVQPVVTGKETSASIEPFKNKEQPDEVISQKESVEVIAQEKANEAFLVSESGEKPDEDHPTKEFVSVNKEMREKPDITPVPDLSVEPPKKEVHPIEVLTVEEQVEVITKEIIVTTEPPTEKEQPIEVHPQKESEEATKIKITEPTELPKEKEDNEVLPVQESRDVTTDKISEIAEIPKENELLTEAHLMKELEVISEGTSDSTEPPKNKNQQDEALSHKEPLEVIEKETSASFEPPKNKEQAERDLSETESLEVIAKEISAFSEPPKNKEQEDEGFPPTELRELREMKGKETSDSTLSSEEVVKHEPQIIEEKYSVGELPELIKHVQNTYVEAETVKDEKELVLEDDIDPPTKGGNVQEEDAQCVVESDEQISVGQVAKSGLMDDSGKGLEKEQPDTTCVPELSIESPKKEDSIEVIPSKHVEVIEQKKVEAVELPTEREQHSGVHLLKGSEVEKEITETKELPKEKEQAVEVQSVHLQESKEVIAENINESAEIPKDGELLNEVQPVKELEVMVRDNSESIKPPRNKEQPNDAPCEKESEVIAEDIGESFIPSKDMEQADEGFPVIGSEEMGAKEVSDSTLGSEEIEKQEPKVTQVRYSKGELPEITNLIQNDYVEVETEPIMKGENVEDQKSLAIGDDSAPPLGVGQIHQEEEQCTIKSDQQDSIDQRGQPSVELAAPSFPPHDAKEDEKKEASNIDVVAQLSVVEAPAMEKVGEENEEKGVRTEKADEDKHENIQNITLPREEMAPRDYETDAAVAGKSIDDQKAGEVVDLIAETKVESITDEKLAPVETADAQVNETAKEPQEFELEVKNEETVRARGEVPKVNDKKEVPSKPSHKHSHNILSKVKQSLVKAKKAIIGKSPSSKTLSSEARDDIKVK